MIARRRQLKTGFPDNCLGEWPEGVVRPVLPCRICGQWTHANGVYLPPADELRKRRRVALYAICEGHARDRILAAQPRVEDEYFALLAREAASN